MRVRSSGASRCSAPSLRLRITFCYTLYQRDCTAHTLRTLMVSRTSLMRSLPGSCRKHEMCMQQAKEVSQHACLQTTQWEADQHKQNNARK